MAPSPQMLAWSRQPTNAHRETREGRTEGGIKLWKDYQFHSRRRTSHAGWEANASGSVLITYTALDSYKNHIIETLISVLCSSTDWRLAIMKTFERTSLVCCLIWSSYWSNHRSQDQGVWIFATAPWSTKVQLQMMFPIYLERHALTAANILVCVWAVSPRIVGL
jgi:hypothetical protein